MGRSSVDYDFRGALKPCGKDGRLTSERYPSGKCTGKGCQWYLMCDLSQKDPWEEPKMPLVGRMAC